MLPPLPGWIVAGAAGTLDVAMFRSGAALAHLAQVMGQADVPQALWRDRLALAAAEACAGFSGRREGARALRDAVHLTLPGDDPGPAGRVLRHWSRAVARPISVAGLARALEGVAAERIALCLDAVAPTPVDAAAQVIEAVLADTPRAETAALILADAVLAKSLGWDHILPLLSLSLTSREPIWPAGRHGCGRWCRSCGRRLRRGRSSCSCRAMRWRPRRWSSCPTAPRGGFAAGWSTWVPCAN